MGESTRSLPDFEQEHLDSQIEDGVLLGYSMRNSAGPEGS